MYHCELFDRPPNVILSADPALNPDNYAVLTVFLSLKEDKVIGLALDLHHMSSLTLILTKAKSIVNAFGSVTRSIVSFGLNSLYMLVKRYFTT